MRVCIRKEVSTLDMKRILLGRFQKIVEA